MGKRCAMSVKVDTAVLHDKGSFSYYNQYYCGLVMTDLIREKALVSAMESEEKFED